ncbi:mannose-6-phosphate isomerase, partial [bacterium]
MRTANYNKNPFVAVPNGEGRCVEGWNAISERLSGATGVIAVECYPGVDEETVRCELSSRLNPALVVETRGLMRPEAEIESLVEPFLGGDDPVFGFLSGLNLPEFFDAEKV